jgi:hypothetical protein
VLQPAGDGDVRAGVARQTKPADAWIDRGQPFDDGKRVITGVIVDDNPFPVDVTQDGGKTLVKRGQIRLLVESRSDDGDQRPPPAARFSSSMTRS